MISAPPTPASEPSPICERCKIDQDPFCIGCEWLKEHDRAIREDTFEEGKKAALLELDNLNLCTVTGYEAGLKEGTRKGALEEHDRAIREDERLKENKRILDIMDKWFKEHDCWKSKANYWTPVPFPASDLMHTVEALRLSQPPEPQERESKRPPN